MVKDLKHNAICPDLKKFKKKKKIQSLYDPSQYEKDHKGFGTEMNHCESHYCQMKKTRESGELFQNYAKSSK